MCYISVTHLLVPVCRSLALRLQAEVWCMNDNALAFLHHMTCYNETKETTVNTHHELRRDG